MKLFDRILDNKNRPHDEEERLMFEMEQIGKRIAGLRKSNNMTQQDLADRLGVTYQAVSNWERGLSMPDVVRLKDLAALFGLSLDEIMGNEKDARIVRVASGDTNADTIHELVESAPYMKPKDLEAQLLKKAGISAGEPQPAPKAEADVKIDPVAPAPMPSASPAMEVSHPVDTASIAETDEESSSGSKFSLEDILSMAPFVSSDTLMLLTMHLLKSEPATGIDFLPALAPFLDSDDLDKLVEYCFDLDKTLSGEILVSLLPHLDSEALDSIVDRILGSDSPIKPEFLLAMAPFLEPETLTKIIKTYGADDRIPEEILLGLAPFLDEDGIQLLLNRTTVSRDLIRRLLPFTDSDVMDEFIKSWIKKK